jgi:hypothetical protein
MSVRMVKRRSSPNEFSLNFMLRVFLLNIVETFRFRLKSDKKTDNLHADLRSFIQLVVITEP